MVGACDDTWHMPISSGKGNEQRKGEVLVRTILHRKRSSERNWGVRSNIEGGVGLGEELTKDVTHWVRKGGRNSWVGGERRTEVEKTLVQRSTAEGKRAQ